MLCVGWIILQALALRFSIELTWSQAITDAVVTNVLLAGAGYTMMSMMRFYQPRQALRLVLSIALAAVSVYIMRFVLRQIIPDDSYQVFLEKSVFIRSLYAWLMIGLISAAIWLWFYIKDQQEMEQRKTNTEKLAREAELSTLRQQLQPHFLFNSLNSISALAGSKPEEARKMIQQLSDFLRGTLKKDDQQLVTLSEELQHLQLYLEIEKVRFGHRLKTDIQTHALAATMQLPSLLLQPIVENAIKFGLYDTTGEITISLTALAEENYLIIRVQNPFDPATAKPKQGTGFGLNSVQRRLYLLYARHDLLVTEQDGNIFTTQVKIPQSV